MRRVPARRSGPAVIELGYINPWNLALLIARYYPLPVVNLRTRPDASFAVDFLPQELLRAHRIVPLTITEETATIAMVDPLDRDFLDEIAARTGKEIRPVLTTDRDVDWALRRLYRTDNIATSTRGLVRTQPENSAHVTFERRQIVGGALPGIGRDHQPAARLGADVGRGQYPSHDHLRHVLLLQGIPHPARRYRQPRHRRRPQRISPPYETKTCRHSRCSSRSTRRRPSSRCCSRAIANLDYPAIKLDVKILLEEEDEETLAAVRAARPPEHFKIVRVPDAHRRRSRRRATTA